MLYLVFDNEIGQQEYGEKTFNFIKVIYYLNQHLDHSTCNLCQGSQPNICFGLFICFQMNDVTDIYIHNATVIPPECDTIPTYWGYITAAIAVLFYGTMYVPVKKYETGDGIIIKC